MLSPFHGVLPMSKIPFAFALLTTLCLVSPAARAGNPIIDKVMKDQADRIPADAMKTAFDFYTDHADQVKNKNYVTIVDFNKPSTEKRMHIINMQTGEVEDLYVAHGKNSGENYATKFSNKAGSFQSSLGLYLTAEEYVGKHGLSLRIDGLEPTNDNVRSRDIVMHGATYVSEDFAKKEGRMGRSEGCFAVPQPEIARLVKLLEGKSILLAYRGTGPEAGHDKDEKIDSTKTDSTKKNE